MHELEGLHSADEVCSRFPVGEGNNIHIINAGLEINRMMRYLNGAEPENWDAVQGLSVLDLGCGSSHIHAPHFYIEEPDFCRLLGLNGAEVHGIDKYPGYPQDKEIYTHIVTDLSDIVWARELSELPDLIGKKFDVIHSFRLFGPGIMAAPQFLIQLSLLGLNRETFTIILLEELNDLLKEGGLIQFDNDAWRKVDGELVPC